MFAPRSLAAILSHRLLLARLARRRSTLSRPEFAAGPALLLAVFAAALPAFAQTTAAIVVRPPASTPAAGAQFSTIVLIEGVDDLRGFQFDITFDPSVLALESIELGPFLASSGRSAQALGPDLGAAASGQASFGGYTLGRNDQPGAAGDGVLAVITWQALQPGSTEIGLSRVLLAGPGGEPLPVAAGEPVAVAIAGAAPDLWPWIAAAGALAAAAAGTVVWRRRVRRREGDRIA